MRRFPALTATAIAVLSAVLFVSGCAADESAGDEPLSFQPPGGSVEDGAGESESSAGTINIAAAANLREALEEAKGRMEETCGTRITFVFGSSGRLRTQVLAGAQFGVFLSADADFIEEIFQKGRVVPNGAGAYGVGRLAMIWRNGIDEPTDLPSISASEFGTIAIANPSHAPYGRAAEEALREAGILHAVEDRLVLGDNVRQAVDYAETGNADAALVALALIVDSGRPFKLIDPSLHEPILQTGAVIRDTGAELTGRCILQYLLDPEGQALLGEFGFEPVEL